ncbi:hypothetical protein ONZ51_g6403 [Trametes cubensis]|uniref:Uncharacterized protein n=1 Tax=Trametes cubensis TaxID=1111947 RepID=A0AAD7X8D6_9APHY|nr:hypothetical protein ONZ51_g6403 [Trametes cubensis]
MVVLDEKSVSMLPPPPTSRAPPTLVTLPPHLLLRIVYDTFSGGPVKSQRKVLYWLTMSLRLVNRALYIGKPASISFADPSGVWSSSRAARSGSIGIYAHIDLVLAFSSCMHVLRSTYLPAYSALVRPPYTSDPFPLSLPDSPYVPTSSSSPRSGTASLLPLQSVQRETHVLDLFIALKVREDVWADESELHLEREESFKDLFDLMQPRARLEDLVRTYGAREGVVSTSSGSSYASSPTASMPLLSPPCPNAKKGMNGYGAQMSSSPRWANGASRAASSRIPFSALSVSFSPRAVGLVLTTRERKKTIVQVPRMREETLEVSARKLVGELRAWVASNGGFGVR